MQSGSTTQKMSQSHPLARAIQHIHIFQGLSWVFSWLVLKLQNRHALEICSKHVPEKSFWFLLVLIGQIFLEKN
jgi:hypothetical protein